MLCWRVNQMSKSIKIAVITLLLGIILALSFYAGCALGSRANPSAQVGLDTVQQAWNIIFDDYVDKDKLDAARLSEAAIKAMVEELDDPYTSYLDPETHELSLTGLRGKFEGIGAHVAIRDEQLTIIAPIDGSPAARAGIKAGDVILEVNGQPTSEMSLTEAVLIIRGPEGTSVKLLVLHQGETEPVEIEIVRAEIEISSVRLEMREDIAYIRITHFSERTAAELSQTMQSVSREMATGIIIDLRNNPGGLVQAVIDVAGHFLPEGIVLNVVDNRGNQTSMEVEPGDSVTELPMIILVNDFSASGSEVLAGALQDYGRATIAGSKTFGKGSVNVLRPLKDGSGLYITTARWLTPEGHLIEGKGIEPDYVLELEGEDAIQWAIDSLKSNK